MPPKKKLTITLDPRVFASIEEVAGIANTHPAKYAAKIIESWYGKYSPPISNCDEHLRFEKQFPGCKWPVSDSPQNN